MAGRRPSVPSSSSDTGRIIVPKLNQDPVWSLKPWPVVFTMGHLTIEIPAMPAADWLAVLMEFDLDTLITEFMPQAEDLMYEGKLGLEELYQAGMDVITLVSARPWWITLRLISVAKGSWDVIGGELVYRHIDAAQLSLSAWLDALLLVILRSMEERDVTMFTMKLELPPENVEQEETEMSADSFLAMGR